MTLNWLNYRAQLERFRSIPLNFDPNRHAEFTPSNGWQQDQSSVELPTADKTWELAKQIVFHYQFPPPELIVGIFNPDEPLSERVMLLRARFLFLPFFFGVRIGQVIDEQRDDPVYGKAQVWGYSYQTLEGHFEMGEITFTVWKFLDSNRLEFRMQSYSKRSFIPNPLYRVGFRLFGRILQRYFVRRSLRRIVDLVANH